MKHARKLLTILVWLAAPAAWAQTAPSLRGTVTDPSGASIPQAVVEVRGGGRNQRVTTSADGKYSFGALAAGKYQLRITASGFSAAERPDVDISAPIVLDVQLAIQTEAQAVTVQDQVNGVNVDPSANAGALVLGAKELAALSDDPDELQQQLQAMAGPGAGPNGGQIYIDGFTGGQMPPKSSIREIRINSNPFSPEYDKPGFGRIEIFTKPGTDFVRGQVFFQYNNQNLDARSPLLTQSSLPPYSQRFFGANLSGPVVKNKASFSLDLDQRNITENAFVLATTLDKNLNPESVDQAVETPQTRTSVSPRLDYMLNAQNTLTLRYQYTRIGSDNQGVGSYSLSSTGYNQRTTENTVQATETAVLSPSTVSESRFQFLRSSLADTVAGSSPQINVQGAFTDGSAIVGNSSTISDRFELSNGTTYTHKTHMFKFGFRSRGQLDRDTSLQNFNGTFTFLGGTGPQLDANNQPIPGTSIQLTALQVYQRTLLFRSLNYTAAQILALGGGATQFSRAAGSPTSRVNGFDAGIFFNDDWRVRPNLTLSYGLRYETQTNISDHADFAPRVGIAWGIDSHGGRAGKTVLRVGAGVFYDRVANSNILSALRYNGSTQQSYLFLNPDFFPNLPATSTLEGSQTPQTLQLLANKLRAPQTYQANIGLERQINKAARISVNYITTRGVHLLDTRDINAPINGVYPYGDDRIRILTESGGELRTNQLTISPNVNFKGMFLFGFYNLSYGKDDNEGQPADPYNLRAEWGPSSFADIRHRGVIGTNFPLPKGFSIAPFIMMQSGTPYNITTGRDPYGIGVSTERPALVTLPDASCSGGSLLYEPGLGCFDLNPAPGEPVISRNYARGPGIINVNLRATKTWAFGRRGESGPAGQDGGLPPGPPPAGGGGRGGGPGGGGGLRPAVALLPELLALPPA